MKNHLHPDEKVRRHPALYVTLMRAAGGKGITYTGYADFRKGW